MYFSSFLRSLTSKILSFIGAATATVDRYFGEGAQRSTPIYNAVSTMYGHNTIRGLTMFYPVFKSGQ
tara:strand:- start:139 stop:339 length:201 start_codon:yes stop_codon:yes gene_type:complete